MRCCCAECARPFLLTTTPLTIEVYQMKHFPCAHDLEHHHQYLECSARLLVHNTITIFSIPKKFAWVISRRGRNPRIREDKGATIYMVHTSVVIAG